jgi:heme-degrading monooxygenase HmoA
VLLWSGLQLRRAVLHSSGAVGVALRAHVIAGRYYTVSTWVDEESLLAFARSEQHRAAVESIRQAGTPDGVLISTCHRWHRAL